MLSLRVLGAFLARKVEPLIKLPTSRRGEILLDAPYEAYIADCRQGLSTQQQRYFLRLAETIAADGRKVKLCLLYGLEEPRKAEYIIVLVEKKGQSSHPEIDEAVQRNILSPISGEKLNELLLKQFGIEQLPTWILRGV